MFNIFKRKKLKKFVDIAVDKGLVSEREVEEALGDQKEYLEKHKIHKEIGAILTEKGVLTPNDVKSILEDQKSQISLMAWLVALFRMSH
ncbi:MAG: hypothetical protein WBB86_02295 [Candidatus Omnitrophota bacterium]